MHVRDLRKVPSVALVDDVGRPLHGLWRDMAAIGLTDDGGEDVVVLEMEPRACEPRPWPPGVKVIRASGTATLSLADISRDIDNAFVRSASSRPSVLMIDSFGRLWSRASGEGGGEAAVWRAWLTWRRAHRVVALIHRDTAPLAVTDHLVGLCDASAIVVEDKDECVLPARALTTQTEPFEAVVRIQARGAKAQAERVLIKMDSATSACTFSPAPPPVSAPPSASTQAAPGTSQGRPVATAPDPTANLPFNLRLTESQRAARSQVVLPYLQAQQQSSGRSGVVGMSTIEYDPTEEGEDVNNPVDDDFDPEDPDDDLDI